MKSTYDTFGYSAMIRDALRGVVRKVLQKTQDFGMPPEHHFYITFKTMAQQVVLPLYLRQKYPESMTIVLQYQFQNLRVGEKGFSVALGFGGKFENLYIPFAAIEMFSDPEAELVFSFQENTKGLTQANGQTGANPNMKSNRNEVKKSERHLSLSPPNDAGDDSGDASISEQASDSANNSADDASGKSSNDSPGSSHGSSPGSSPSGSSSDDSSDYYSDSNLLGTISYGFQQPPSDHKSDKPKLIETNEPREVAKVLKFRAKKQNAHGDSIAPVTKKKVTRKNNRGSSSPENKPENSSPNDPKDANNDSPIP